MPSTQVSSKSVALTGNGTAAGLVTIASNTGWVTGTKVTLSSTAEDPLECIVVEMIGSTQLRLRALTNRARHGFSNVAAYLVADGARISRVTQVVPVLSVFEEKQKA